MSESLIYLRRQEYGENGTRGRWEMPNGTGWWTIEMPWRGNAVGESCIPEGVYTLRKRRSGVVERSTGGEYLFGWEVCDVEGRTYIMVHPGNTILDLEGCIAPGIGRGTLYDLPAVTNSQIAFDELMAALEVREEWTIDVRAAEGVESPQWP